jgi:hypothetical protein
MACSIDNTDRQERGAVPRTWLTSMLTVPRVSRHAIIGLSVYRDKGLTNNSPSEQSSMI